MNELFDYISSYVTLSEEARDAIQRYAQFENVNKNQFILKDGQHCNHIWFLASGMVRKFYLHEGKEITTWIHTENETFTSLQSYGQKIAANESIQACENSTIIGISRENSKKLAKYDEIIQFTNKMMEQQFAAIDRNTRQLNNLDARGKYNYLNTIAPELVKRAKLGHIASLLGMTQETLSRIRKE